MQASFLFALNHCLFQLRCHLLAGPGQYYGWNLAGLVLLWLLAYWFYKTKRAVGAAKFVAFLGALTFALCLIMR